MKVLATVEDGKLVPNNPIRFSRRTVEIEVPDDVVENENSDQKPTKAAEPTAEGPKGQLKFEEIFTKLHANLGEGYVYVEDGRSDQERFAEALDLFRK